jgi:hypothetical protein
MEGEEHPLSTWSCMACASGVRIPVVPSSDQMRVIPTVLDITHAVQVRLLEGED